MVRERDWSRGVAEADQGRGGIGGIPAALQDRPAGHFLLNPFDSGGNHDFNVWYSLMDLAVGIYGTMAWQNVGGYNSAALSAHEGRMGGVLSRWREFGKMAVVTFLGVCALTFLNYPHFAAGAAAAHAQTGQISDPKVQAQMLMPIAVSHFLPVGVKGVLCAILLMGLFGGDVTHLHSWGGIFVQDVLMPFRKKPFTPRQHLRDMIATITAAGGSPKYTEYPGVKHDSFKEIAERLGYDNVFYFSRQFRKFRACRRWPTAAAARPRRAVSLRFVCYLFPA